MTYRDADEADCWLLSEYQAAILYDKFVPVVTAYVMNGIMTFLCIYFKIIFIFSI